MKIKFIVLLNLFFSISISAQSEIKAEELQLKNDSVVLPGTLTYLKNNEKQSLVIYVHGSGNVDRNGNQAGAINANYIKQLAEALNKNGIAFYRYDKRTATQANMKFLMQGVVFTDFVEDAKIAIEHFKNDDRFSSITLIGHSQGSLVAMLAISEAVDKYISIAGPASTIDKTITAQLRKQNGDSIAGIAASHFEELRETGKIKKVNPMLFQLFNPQNLGFFKSWMMYSPEEEIAKLDLPILIIGGEKDIQVPVEEAKALHQASSNSALVLLPSMNHVLKSITKNEDNLKSYGSPDFPIAEQLVTEISNFVKK